LDVVVLGTVVVGGKRGRKKPHIHKGREKETNEREEEKEKEKKSLIHCR